MKKIFPYLIFLVCISFYSTLHAQEIPISIFGKEDGHPLPFLEQWNLGTFETNNWLTDGPNWSINWQEGQPLPSAQFTWDPIQTDYQVSLESYPLLADSITEGDIYLDFNLKLDNFQPTGTEQMLVQVWNWDSEEWTTVSTYSNEDGSFDWMAEHLKITSQALGKVFRIRFAASGENSLNIVGWYLDNIHVYRDCEKPENLEIIWNSQSNLMELDWEGPDEIESQWIHWDDGENQGNSIGGPMIFDVAARWEPAQLFQYDGAELTEIAFFPGEVASTYNVRVWVGSGEPLMVVDQPVENPVINEWNYIILDNPLQIDISQELWVGYHIDCETGYPAGVDDGPAIDGYGNMMYFGEWSTMLEINPELDYNWNIAAYIQQDSIVGELTKYAIYRSDDSEPYFLRDYAEQSYYQDDSICWEVPHIFFSYKVTALYISENDICESAFSNESAEVCEGVHENKDIPDLNIYPNPASDVLYIEAEEEIESVSIFDSRGEEVIGRKGDKETGRKGEEGKVVIPLNGLVPGLYLVRVETGSGVVGRKIVVGW